MADRRARWAARLAAQRPRNLEAGRAWNLMGGPPPRDALGRTADRHPRAVGVVLASLLLLFIATAVGFVAVELVQHPEPAASTSARP